MLAVEAAWTRLANGHPLRSPNWLMTWWQQYLAHGPHRRHRETLFVLVVHDATGGLIGLAPWYCQRSAVTGTTVRFLGDGEVCTDHSTILAQPGSQWLVADQIASWLVKASRNRLWQRLWFESLDANDPMIARLVDRLETRGAYVQRRFATASWSVDLPATWDEYLALLSKNHRKKCRRIYRSWIESERIHVRHVQQLSELGTAMETLRKLHHLRRTSVGEKGVFEGARFRAFHQLAASRLWTTDQLQVLWLELDGRPIAAEYLLCSPTSVFAYQSGMDPSVTQVSPGNLAVIAALRWAIESGRQQFDFLRGDEPYKQRWKAKPTAAIDLAVRPSGWVSGMGHVVTLAGRRTRNLLGNVRQRLDA